MCVHVCVRVRIIIRHRKRLIILKSFIFVHLIVYLKKKLLFTKLKIEININLEFNVNLIIRFDL